MEIEEIQKKIDFAIALLLQQDAHLLRIDVNERSITHRLALYLQEEFSEWHVDCEYNRNGDDTKRLHIPKNLDKYVVSSRTDDTKGSTVFPDIIVHRRGTSENLLVIEVKKTTSQIADDFDLLKLREYKNQLRYKYAIFIKFVVGEYDVSVNDPMWI